MLSNPKPTRPVLSPFYNEKSERLRECGWAGVERGPRFPQSSLVVTTLEGGGQIWWQKHRNPQSTGTRPLPWMLQSILEPETELSQFVSFWYKASCCFPGDRPGPQLWHWVLGIALLGGSRELFAVFRTPWKKGSCSQPRTCPERFGFLFVGFLPSLSLLPHPKFLVIVPSVGSGDNLPLCWQIRRERSSTLTILAWCVCVQNAGFSHCYLGKRKQMLTTTPWEFTLLRCKILHY